MLRVATNAASHRSTGADCAPCELGSSETAVTRVVRSWSDDAFVVFEVVAAPSAGPAMHFHTYDEIFDIVDGCMTFCLDGKLIEAATGVSIVVPAGTYHTWINRSGEPVSMRVKLPPHAAYEAMFCRPEALPASEFCNLAASHGVLVVGPPLVG